MLGVHPLRDLFPDPRRPALADHRFRNQFGSAALTTTHTSLSVSDEQQQFITVPQRIRSVRVGDVSGGTVTIQVQVDGRDVFQDSVRPVSGGAEVEPHMRDRWIIPARTPVKTIIEATSGVPTGSANVVLEMEPYFLLPRLENVELHGKDRLFPSRRREAELANAGYNLLEQSPAGFIREADADNPAAQSQERGYQDTDPALKREAPGIRLPPPPPGPR